MLELVDGLPGRVVGLRAKGRVTADDYRHVVRPAVDSALSKYDKLCLYYEFGAQFEGMDAEAMVQDLEVGIRSLPHWDKVAIVSDVAWIRQSASLFAFMIHGKVRVFRNSEASAARQWIAQA